MNEPITLMVKIEGRGNVTAIEEPKVKWPEPIEMYESKGRVKTGSGGVSEKVFEFLLIPRVAGKMEIPELEFGFFDPEKNEYVTKSTKKAELNVLPDASGSVVGVRTKSKQSAAINPDQQGKTITSEDIRYLKPSFEDVRRFYGHPWWRWSYWLSVFGLICFLGAVVTHQLYSGIDRIRSEKSKNGKELTKVWKTLHSQVRSLHRNGNWQEVVRIYELMGENLLDALDRRYGVGARSFSRSELGRLLVDEQQMDVALWRRLDHILEFVEAVRFAGGSGVVSEQSAREKLKSYLSEGENLIRQLG